MPRYVPQSFVLTAVLIVCMDQLWMGTHPSSPSLLLDGTSLSEYLADNPSLIGDDIITTFNAENGNIPFLFKILAIEKALSIQTHPDKQLAERLHSERPDIYKGTYPVLCF